MAALVADVRAAIRKGDFAAAEALVERSRAEKGTTPENLLALSWLARGAYGAKNYAAAEKYAAETKSLALAMLAARKIDDEADLPIALGAAIEVEAQILAAQNERDRAVAYLRDELARYRDTSMRARIQKNINLISLEGKPAPEFEVRDYLGPKPKKLSAYTGRPVLLFFWAHWCSDCKAQGPVIARLAQEFGPRLMILGPTQRYGYTLRGQDAGPEEEKKHIESVRQQHYGALADMPVPLSEENFRNWGGSTTPTLVLIDAKGIVRLYNPGQLPYELLAQRIRELLSAD